MTLTQYNIRIENEKFGTLLKETFIDPIQYKLFLKMVQSCIELKNKHLVESIILTTTPQYSAADVLISKSKIEAEHTKK